MTNLCKQIEEQVPPGESGSHKQENIAENNKRQEAVKSYDHPHPNLTF